MASATIASFLALLWSALKVFRGLDTAVSRVYGRGANSIITQFKNGLIVLVAVVIGLILTIGIGTVVAFLSFQNIVAGISTVAVVGALVTLFGLVLTLFPFYYVLPGEHVTIREALPGAVFTAVGWTILQVVFRFYTAVVGNYEAYGVIGAVLLLVTLLYFAGMVLLLGVVLNAVLAGRTSRPDETSSDELAAALKNDKKYE